MRDRLAAYARAAGSIAFGAGLLYALGSWLGWPVVAALVLIAIGDFAWCFWQLAARLPTRRPW